jgi:IclR family transcriptional regulator, acetate operon repressor
VGKYQVPAVVGAIAVLKELGGPGENGSTQAELADATGLSKSTLHNLLATLETHEYVRRDADTRRYRLGPALIPLGTAASRQVKLVRSTIDRIAPMAEKHHLSFAVAQRTGEDEVQIIERFYPARDVHVGITIGSTYGPLDGALGKVLLSAMDPERAVRLIKGRKLPAHTDATITSPEDLISEIEQVRERGWAASRGELNENNAVAAGIWTQSGELGLMLLVLGFANQLDNGRVEEIGDLLTETAATIMAEAGASR